MDYDVIVIGGGAAGLAAARTAVRRRARVLLISDGPIGGDCTFTGCVPSKALIEAAARGATFGEAMASAHRAIVAIAETEDDAALKSEGIDVLHAHAGFVSPGQVTADGRRTSARAFVVATGARPAIPAEFVQTNPLTSENVFDLTEPPESLTVVGGGATGCELAQAFARLGTRVTVVELADRLLPAEDPEVSEVIARVFAAEGVDVRVRARVRRAEVYGLRVRLLLEDGSEVDADRLLVATGRAPVTDGLGLEVAGVRRDDRGNVITDRHLATTAPGIYAAGDVTGRQPYTHAAYVMGRVAAANALGRRRSTYHETGIPRVIFTDPEVAHVGVTEAEAPTGARVAHLAMAEFDRAVIAGRTEGFVKLIAGPRPVLGNAGGGRLLGGTVVAPRAGEIIHEAVLAIRTGMFAGRLAQAVHAYPTWSIAIQQAAAQFVGHGPEPRRKKA